MLAMFETRDGNLIRQHMKKLGDHPAHFHKYVEILMPKDNDVNIYVGGQKYTLRKGELYIMFPYIVHHNDAAASRMELLQFHPEVLPLFRDVFVSKKPVSPFASVKNVTPFMLSLLEKIIDTNPEGFGGEIILGCLTALVGEILQNIELVETGVADADTTYNIILYCTKNFRRDITIDSVAKDNHVSKSYVTYIFSKRLHYNFRAFINDLRVDAAQKLLTDSEKHVTDILLECGFQNQSTFNKAFIKRCGITPLKYRKEYQTKK